MTHLYTHDIAKLQEQGYFECMFMFECVCVRVCVYMFMFVCVRVCVCVCACVCMCGFNKRDMTHLYTKDNEVLQVQGYSENVQQEL